MRTDRILAWLGGTAVLAAVVGVIVTGAWSWSRLFDEFLGSGRCVEHYLAAREDPDGPVARVLVAGLLHDREAERHGQVLRTLRTFYAEANAPIVFEAVASANDGPCALQPARGGRDDAVAAGRETAARLFAATGAELVIWGRISPDDGRAILRLSEATDAPGNGGEPELVEETLVVAESATPAVGAMLAARAARIATADPSLPQEWLGAVTEQAITVLQPLATDPPEGIGDRRHGELLSAYARARQARSTLPGRGDDLAEAAAAYREAAAAYEATGARAQWVRAQNDHGTALTALATSTGNPAQLHAAVAAYRGVLGALPRGDSPVDWATTQNNLGNALQALGARERDAAHLEEAVAAYRAALKVRTADRFPRERATTQMNLGTALATLGGPENGTARLEEAVAAFRGALEGFDRATAPHDWGTTQNNLGNVLQRLAAREKGPERLEEAVDAYRMALDVFTRETAPFEWATTQGNIAHALTASYERTGDPAQLDNAERRVEAALELWREADAVFYVEKAERQLARIAELRSAQ